LGLGQAAQSLDAILEAAGRNQSTYLSFLNELLEAELKERQRRNVEVRMKLAHLPYRRTLNEFDFSFQPGVDERLIRELAGLTFIGRQENVLFLGPPGVGKTHLAIALAMEAIGQGLPVYFVSLAQLVNDLRKAYEENRLDKRMRVYLRPRLQECEGRQVQRHNHVPHFGGASRSTIRGMSNTAEMVSATKVKNTL